jgi:crotonyl-CoA carboxylase/reductase
MAKELYDLGEMPPLGEVPEKMHAWLIRAERFGPPTRRSSRRSSTSRRSPTTRCSSTSWRPASTTTTSGPAWASRSTSSVPATRPSRTGEDFHIGGSDASGIVYKPSARTSPTSRSATRSSCTAASGPQTARGSRAGGDPMYSPTFRIWGYETNWGSFAQFTKVQAQQCMPKPKHLTWEEAAAYTLVAATAWRMLHGWGAQRRQARRRRLIWGGAGGLGSMAIQIVKAAGATRSPWSRAKTSSTTA